jgi:hypothetical protein
MDEGAQIKTVNESPKIPLALADSDRRTYCIREPRKASAGIYLRIFVEQRNGT